MRLNIRLLLQWVLIVLVIFPETLDAGYLDPRTLRDEMLDWAFCNYHLGVKVSRQFKEIELC